MDAQECEENMDEIDHIIGADQYVNENCFIETAIDYCYGCPEEMYRPNCDENYPCPYLDKAR